jgi:hypothetical protein
VNPDRQPRPLLVERVEWIPSTVDEIEVRVYGAWQGSTVPPPVSLVIGNDIVAPLPDPPAAGLAPGWTAAYLVPVESRAALEEGNAAIAGPDFALPLPAAVPGALDPPPGTVVDPAVLSERRARRAELADEGASARAVSAEQTVETLRAHLALLEERAARVGEARDALAARVADAEQRLRLAERREEAERRRREELEEGEQRRREKIEDEAAGSRRHVEAELDDLRGRLAAAEEAVTALEAELEETRRSAEEATRAFESESTARREAEEAAARATAEAESLREEAERLREEAEALRSAAGDPAEEIASLRAEVESVRARAALADDFRAEADSLRAEAESLRAEAESLRARAREADALRAETEILRSRASMVEDLRARTAELERRLVAEPRRGEAEALRARAAELERRLAAERAARVAAEERLAAADRPQSDHERALIAQVAALEAELGRRTAVQERVQEAIALIRVELAQVRSQMRAAEPARAAETAATAELRARLSELEDRGRALDAAVRAREAELQGARDELDRARREAADARAERDAARHSAAEARELAEQLRERLAAEQALRERAERRLAEGAEPAGPSPAAAATGDPALDTLIAGLREQVAAAKAQLAPRAGEHPPAEPPRAAHPPAEPPSTAAARPGQSQAAERPPGEPLSTAAAPAGQREGAEPAPSAIEPGDETRRRLQAIAAELRAAIPEQAAAGAHDVIGDLQRAAERLRAAAEQELARLEQAGEGPGGSQAAVPPGAAIEELRSRRVVNGAPETAWLRRGLERLSVLEPETAARLLAALLPVQALVADDLAYDLTAPTAGTLRVVLTGGTAHVEPRDRPGILGHVDALVEGRLEALAPLAAGGAGRRLKGVRISGSRRRMRKLVKARRDPVTLVDLGRAGSPVHPGLLLSALAAAVEPAWTRGHRFAVAYAIGGDGTFTVVADDGAPLLVLPDTPREAGDLAATVVVSAPAFMPLIAGDPPPQNETATVVGDRRVVNVLHTWFDAARGVASR